MRTRALVVTAVCVLLPCISWTQEPPAKPGEESAIKVYDIHDLVQQPRASEPPEVEAKRQARLQAEEIAQNLVPGTLLDAEDEAPEERAQNLCDMVRQLVDPGTWDEEGGRGMRVDRQDSLVVLAPPAAQLKVQTLLDDLRKVLRRSQVAVRISLVAIAPEAMDEIVKNGRTVAVTAQEKAALAKSAGKKFSEMQLLATDGRRAELTRTDKADRQGDAPATETTAAAWVIPTVLKDGAVALTFEAGFTKETARAGEKTPSLKSEFRLRTTVQLPDGAMMVLGGGTLGDAGTQQVYVLIEVQVIAPAKAK